MTSIENSRGLRFSKYFPNHAEYASQVRRSATVQRKRRSKDEVDQMEELDRIVTNHKSLSLTTASTQTKKIKFKNKRLQISFKPLTKEQYSNTESILISAKQKPVHCEVYTQAEIPSTTEQVNASQAMPTADENYKVNASQKKPESDENDETPESPEKPKSDKKDKTPESPEKSDKKDKDQTDSDLQTVLNEIKEIGNPRIILSLHGNYDKDWQKDERLKNVFGNVANRAGRCGFFYQSQETTLVQKTVDVEKNIGYPPRLVYGYSDLHKTTNEKTDTKQATNIKTIDRLLVESYVNREMKIAFQNQVDETMRVPVVLFLTRGNLSTLEHVARAIDNDVSVVVLKGSGGAADLIASCIEDLKNLKTASPVIMEVRLGRELYAKLENCVTAIVEKKWLVTILDLEVDSYDILWEKITNGIVRAWSFEEKIDRQGNPKYSHRTISDNEIISISEYVGSTPEISKSELLGGYSLKNNEDDNTNSKQDALFYALLGKNTRTVRQIFKHWQTVTLTMNQLRDMYKKEMNPENKIPNPAISVCKQICPDECRFLEAGNITDIKNTKFKDPLEASYSILNKLMKGLAGLSKLGILTGCRSFETSDNQHIGAYSEGNTNKNGYNENAFCHLNDKENKTGGNQHDVDNPYENTNENGDNQDEVDNPIKRETGGGETEEKVMHPYKKANESDDLPDEKTNNSGNKPDETVKPETNNGNKPDKTVKLEANSGKKRDKTVKPEANSGNKPDKTVKPAANRSNKPDKTVKPAANSSNKPDKTVKPEANSGNKSDESVQPDDILLCQILTSNIALAGPPWTQSENPLLTALFCSRVLNALGMQADEKFQESKQLYEHSERFDRRAERLMEKLFAHDEDMATEALEQVTEIWKCSYSALHFGQQFGMEEFISHPSTQKEANKRLHRYKYPQEEQQTKICFQPAFIPHFLKTKKPFKYLTAPITKIWIQFVMFVASLLMFSVFLLTDLNFNTISSLEVIVFLIMVGDFFEETWNMFRCHDDCTWSQQKILLHLLDTWNFLDMLCFVLYFIAFGIHLAGSEDLIIHVRRLYSVALFIMFLRILNIFLMIKQFGIIVIMVNEMLGDLFKSLVILVILIFAAGVVYHANLYPNHTVAAFTSDIRYWRIWTLLKIPYWQVYGELNLDTLEGFGECTANDTLWRTDPTVERCPEGDWITTFIAAFYMMLTNWLLLNTVIAMFSSRYEKVKDKSEQKWRYHRHTVIINYEHWIPSPINFIVRPIMILNRLAVCPCSMRTTKRGNKMIEKQKEFAREIIEDEIKDNP